LDRYESLKDVNTHDEDLVIICEHNELFGTNIRDIVNDIRDCINGEQLTVEEHPNGKRRVERHEWLVQHSVWFVHYEELLDGEGANTLDRYFTMLAIPRETEVFVCIDDDNEQAAEQLKQEYRDRITIAERKDVLIAQASMHLNHANPANGEAGKQTIKAWNNAVCTLLEDFGGVNYG